MLREAIGVVSIITPWNFPFLIVSQKLPFALAAGCTTVVKPSELTSGSTLVLGEILIEAGVPAGVVNIITGTGPEVGAPMTTDPDVDMVSFTGSTGVGKLTMVNAAQTLKKVSLELGGKNPQIVFPDADLDAFVDAAVFGAYFNAGECCNAGSRLILHKSIAEEVTARIAELAKKVKVGDPLDPTTQVGAIITPQHLEKIGDYVEGAVKAGASVTLGGEALDLGLGQFMVPTILSGVEPDMAVAREEVFGPVLSVLTFETTKEAIRIANAIDYGLSAGVWSRDFDTCLTIGRKVRAGTVWMNTFMDGASNCPSAVIANPASAANSAAMRWRITPKPRRSTCILAPAPAGGCRDDKAFPTIMDGIGFAARSGRREAELRALKDRQVLDGFAGDTLEQQAAHGLASRLQILVDGLDLRLDLAEQPRRLLGDDVIFHAERQAVVAHAGDRGERGNFAGTGISIRRIRLRAAAAHVVADHVGGAVEIERLGDFIGGARFAHRSHEAVQHVLTEGQALGRQDDRDLAPALDDQPLGRLVGEGEIVVIDEGVRSGEFRAAMRNEGKAVFQKQPHTRIEGLSARKIRPSAMPLRMM